MKVLIINLEEVNNKEELHNLLSSKLNFLAWPGKNWDAFWDLITDTELVKMPERLTFIGFKELSEKLLRDAQLLQLRLFDMKEKYPSIVCEIIYS